METVQYICLLGLDNEIHQTLKKFSPDAGPENPHGTIKNQSSFDPKKWIMVFNFFFLLINMNYSTLEFSNRKIKFL